MTNSDHQPAERGAVPGGPSNFGLVAVNIGVMAVILGVGAVLVPSLAVLLGILVILESAGAFYFAKRAAEPDSTVKSQTRARAARGLALLGVALAVVALVKSFL